MDKIKELKDKYYKLSKGQREKAWNSKNYNDAYNIRQEQKKNYEKYKLLNGIIKANEKKGEK